MSAAALTIEGVELFYGAAQALRGVSLPAQPLDEPTEGIQPSVIKDIGRAIEHVRARGDVANLLVEQYLDFARELADRFVIMERGEIILSGDRERLAQDDVAKKLSV